MDGEVFLARLRVAAAGLRSQGAVQDLILERAGSSRDGIAGAAPANRVGFPRPFFEESAEGEYFVNELLALDGWRFVHAAYHAALGRGPDEGGASHYGALLDRGHSKIDILRALKASPEGMGSNTRIVGLDDAQSAPSTASVRTRAAQTHALADLLSMADADFVEAAYEAALGRPSDPGGHAYYTEQLSQGWSRATVLRALLDSEEGRIARRVIVGLDAESSEAAATRSVSDRDAK